MTRPPPAGVRDAARADAFALRCARLGPELMRDLSLTDVQAAGLLGNLGHETGGFRFLQEITPVVPGSRGGWGIAQWTGPRRIAMERWCRERGLDPASDAANEGFLRVELTTTEAPALEALRRAATLEEATEAVCRRFERPGRVALPSRLAFARRALAAIRSAPSSAPALPAAGPPFTRAWRLIMTRVFLALAALAVTIIAASASPVWAADAAAAQTPWGAWLTTALQAVEASLVPMAAAALTAAIAKVAPWAATLLSRQWIEGAIRAGIEYGLNAVAGAVRGRTLSADLGPAVVAAATQHVVATSPAAIVRKAGGVQGVAARIFQALPLEAAASAETVLKPALQLLDGDRPRRS
ncbi:phage tail tip lysozyme [Methylobacterium aerolatum]|uniref:Phage tail lysozyme domain-containing protein n=1 Tax=Methylobacterium aerolatum TaxID=418708 RepID=A0ABU0HVM5_9HYPH|nr:phage tail tip lysozyme [Methylobacterium aerolatum]MDQ0446390.1 hypothetical protein [Methylobacterium aerolatum]GJD33447.1 hypothetical protein FMGBMHLM_0334 [Methylobacterium aerolatum]